MRASVVQVVSLPAIQQVAGTLVGSVGHYARLPHGKLTISGNLATTAVTSVGGETILVHVNNMNFTLLGFTGMPADRYMFAGDAMLAVQLNDTNRTMLRFFTCQETINNTVTANCLYANETEIQGEAKGIFQKQQAVAAGRI